MQLKVEQSSLNEAEHFCSSSYEAWRAQLHINSIRRHYQLLLAGATTTNALVLFAFFIHPIFAIETLSSRNQLFISWAPELSVYT